MAAQLDPKLGNQKVEMSGKLLVVLKVYELVDSLVGELDKLKD